MSKSVIKVGFENGRSTIDLPERETSFEEWMHRRQVAFSELRKDEFIPNELIDLVEGLKERTSVQLYDVRSNHDEMRLGVKVIEEKPKQSVAEQLAKIWTAGKRMYQNNDAMTASEALAFFLRLSLRELKNAEKQGEAAPVRALKLSSRSLIGEIALDLSESCEQWNYAPGPELNGLFRELLNLQSAKHGESREFDAREQAIYIIAQQPDVGTHALAKELSVQASTVSRWRKDPDFNERVKQQSEWINIRKTSGNPLDKAMRLLEEREQTEGRNLFPVIQKPISES